MSAFREYEAPFTAAQLQAARLVGVVERQVDGLRVVEPAYGTRVVRGLLQLERQETAEVSGRVLAAIGLSKAAVGVFLSSRVLVRQTPSEGGGLAVRDRIPGVNLDNLSTFEGTDDGVASTVGVDVGAAGEVIDDRRLVYKLNTVFTDVTVTDKLRLSTRRVQTAKRLAVTDPMLAASMLSDVIRRRGFPNSRVVAGDYAKTISRAKEAIRQMANEIVYRDTEVPARMTPTHVTLTFDGYRGVPEWYVVGPVKHSVETLAFYQLALAYGPEQAVFLLGVETAILQINAFESVSDEPYRGELRGYTSISGIEPMDSRFPPELTVEQQTRLLGASRKVMPVGAAGKVIGTAVRVSERHVVMNTHTLNAAADAELTPELAGKPVYESRSAGQDISVVRHDGDVAQWTLRVADVGERVVLCYSVGATVEYSEVLRVQGVVGGQLFLSESNLLRRGASGAAVVALRDSALLGIFRTKHQATTVCSTFTSESFVQVTELESVVSSEFPLSSPAGEVGSQTYTRMVKRGLLGYLQGISSAVGSLVVNYKGTQKLRGVVVNFSGEWFTTVDPDRDQLCLSNGVPVVFRVDTEGRFKCVDPPPVLQSVPNVRAAQPGERVFVFTRAMEEIVMSRVCVVTHCKANVPQFTIEDIGDSAEELAGGLIVAERDAAVVGQFMRRDMDAFGDVVCLCHNVVATQAAAALPRLPSGLEAPTLGVNTAFREVVAVVGDKRKLEAYAEVGHSVLSALAKTRVYGSGQFAAESVEAPVLDYQVRLEQVLHELGWTAAEWDTGQSVGRRELLGALFGAIFLRNPAGFCGWLIPLWFGDADVVMTPVTGDYPFPRPASTVTSVAGSNAVEHGAGYLGGSRRDSRRLQELEEKFKSLEVLLQERQPK